MLLNTRNGHGGPILSARGLTPLPPLTVTPPADLDGSWRQPHLSGTGSLSGTAKSFYVVPSVPVPPPAAVAASRLSASHGGQVVENQPHHPYAGGTRFFAAPSAVPSFVPTATGSTTQQKPNPGDIDITQNPAENSATVLSMAELDEEEEEEEEESLHEQASKATQVVEHVGNLMGTLQKLHGDNRKWKTKYMQAKKDSFAKFFTETNLGCQAHMFQLWHKIAREEVLERNIVALEAQLRSTNESKAAELNALEAQQDLEFRRREKEVETTEIEHHRQLEELAGLVTQVQAALEECNQKFDENKGIIRDFRLRLSGISSAPPSGEASPRMDPGLKTEFLRVQLHEMLQVMKISNSMCKQQFNVELSRCASYNYFKYILVLLQGGKSESNPRKPLCFYLTQKVI
ncbi:unnamed protein product [Amoebophrya sp. A25]|nr:unnamed protein product [Amoebophrya sp. A25]|eukprot:GSA25T00003526001.1